MSSRRKNIMLGTAGHVDHGKSALVKLLTGCETDTLAEEKQRGLTIDLGFAPCKLADERIVGVVDVPGHVDFIRNMVAGAHGIDVVLFVVAADDGIMPQTREHLHILTLMGLQHGLVALTKIDLVEPSRRAEVSSNLRPLLAGTFLEQAPICPLSNATGEGFENFFDTLNQVVNACEDRSCAGLFRLWVEDVFTIRGSGTVITGIPTSGMVRINESLELLPAALQGRVRRMQVYGEDATEGRAGECVALNVPEIDHEAVRRGMVLTVPGMVAPVIMAEAELQLIGAVREPLPDYFEAHVHVGTASAITRVAMLDTTEMCAGQKQMVQLRLTAPLALAPGDRFVLRANVATSGESGLSTVGGGRILGISNARLRRHKPWTLEMLAKRREALDNPTRWLEVLLQESRQPLSLEELRRRSLLREEEVSQLAQELRAEGRAQVTPNGALAHSSVVEETAALLVSVVEDFHKANPQRAGMSRAELRASAGANPDLFDLAAASLLKTSRLEWNGTVYARKGWNARVSNQELQLCERLGATFQKAGWATPAPQDLAQSLHLAPQQIDRSLRLLQEHGILVRLDEKTLMHRDAVEAAKQVALRLFARASSFSTMDFRDALDVSRKYAVPLLDHLDRVRFTVRSGHTRTPGVEARKLLSAPAKL